jgi:hypothetical protein
VLTVLRTPPPEVAVDVSQWRASFAEGYTEEDIDRVLGQLARLGIHVRCVWDYVDEGGPSGRSILVGLTADGAACELPEGLYRLLCDGEGDGLIYPHAIPPGSPAVDLEATCGWRSVRGFSFALEDRRPAGDHQSPGSPSPAQ